MSLWNDDVKPESYDTAAKEKYQAAIMDQYKLYVEMADRVSARRGLTNTFFLTLNSIVFTLFGVFWKDKPGAVSDEAYILLLVVALAQCGTWWLIVRSYRQLNGAKFQVVGDLEQRLPASPYQKAEWQDKLAAGENWRVYLPLTHAEQWVPLIFAAAYCLGFAFAVF